MEVVKNELLSSVLHQGHLENVVKSLFPVKLIPNARKESQITNPKTGYFIELDIWLPDLELCFEFQDDYHYVTSWYSHAPLSLIQEKDAFKRENIQAKYVTIITVPCWWDGDVSRLAATINFQRPDLNINTQNASPVPLNPPSLYFKGGGVPDVGELMYASFPSYFSGFADTVSLSNPWWMGEKYDGIRVCWNPLRQSLFGRGFFAEAQKIKSGENVDYPFARVIAFDKPDRSTERLKFDDLKCSNPHLLKEKLEEVIKDGGEGIILRKPASLYERGRSTSLWKLKATREDGEALVLEAISSTTYLLQTAEGTIFEAPRNSAQEPKRGDVVSFSYESFSRRSVPIHPEIFRIRQDVTWDDVVESFVREDSRKSQALNDASLKASKIEYSAKPSGYWTDQSKENNNNNINNNNNNNNNNNVIRFFESFAKKRNLDPLIPDTWYSLSTEFIREKGAKSILSHFNWSYSKALINTFPDIGLDLTKFATIPNNYWDNVQNRRKWFKKYAERKGFNYLNSENWYNVPFEELTQDKAARSMLHKHYYGKLGPALIHLFPEINFDSHRFEKPYAESIKQKEFFISFARDSGFDPLVSNNWYSVIKDDIKARKGGNAILNKHNGDLNAALFSSFPELSFIRSKFEMYWESKENQRSFFETYAFNNNFDALVADNWYSVSLHDILPLSGASKIINRYGGNLAETLIQLFPELKFYRFKFSNMTRNYWTQTKNQRECFETFAKEKGFNPLIASNWYHVNFDSLRAYKGVGSILFYYNGSVIDCLFNIFPNIGLDKALFSKKPNKYWMDENNQKEVLLEFAKENNFDPEVPENWYLINMKSLRSFKNAKQMLAQYGGNIAEAVSTIFNHLQFERNRFYKIIKVPKNYWAEEANRRKFFEDFLATKRLTSFSLHQMYSSDIYKMKNARSVLRYYKGSVYEALIALFPNQMNVK